MVVAMTRRVIGRIERRVFATDANFVAAIPGVTRSVHTVSGEIASFRARRTSSSGTPASISARAPLAAAPEKQSKYKILKTQPSYQSSYGSRRLLRSCTRPDSSIEKYI
jgi:hypothetical protein